jgi:hypothetical protein
MASHATGSTVPRLCRGTVPRALSRTSLAHLPLGLLAIGVVACTGVSGRRDGDGPEAETTHSATSTGGSDGTSLDGSGGSGLDGDPVGSGGSGGNTVGSGGSGGSAAASGDSGGDTVGGDAPGGAGGGDEGGLDGASRSLAEAPVIADFAIEANPNNTLSCFVSWTTDVEANSEVQFGVDGYQYHIVIDESVSSHRVLVIGMHAETDYEIRAVSSDTGGSASAEGSFTTGALPSGLPVATQTVLDTSAAQDGWTLLNVTPASERQGFNGTVPGIIAMYDMQGLPVWYFVNGSTVDVRGDVSALMLPDHHLFLGPSSGEPAKEIDLAGNVLWQGPDQPPADAPSSDPATAPMSHFANKLSNGNYIVLRDLTDANGFGGALVQELSPSNEVVWSWNLFDHMQPPPDAELDWCHPNSVTVDLAEDVLYLSCRYQGIIKAKRSDDQAVLWVLGGQSGGDFTFDPSTARFEDQHDPELHDDGTVLVYSNGGSELRQPAGVTSSVIEVKLDQSAMVATASFVFPGSFAVDDWYAQSWYTPYWGDADRLANGDVLVVAGIRSSTQQTHIFEVRPQDGQVVWEFTFPPGVGSYQGERLSPPPLVEPL